MNSHGDLPKGNLRESLPKQTVFGAFTASRDRSTEVDAVLYAPRRGWLNATLTVYTRRALRGDYPTYWVESVRYPTRHGRETTMNPERASWAADFAELVTTRAVPDTVLPPAWDFLRQFDPLRAEGQDVLIALAKPQVARALTTQCTDPTTKRRLAVSYQ